MLGDVAIIFGVIIVLLLLGSFTSLLCYKEKLSDILLKLSGFLSLILVFVSIADILLKLCVG